MNRVQISVAAVATVAGLACSAASAQVNAQLASPKGSSVSAPAGRAASMVNVDPSRAIIVDPVSMTINGRTVPFRAVDAVAEIPVGDAPVTVVGYDSFVNNGYNGSAGSGGSTLLGPVLPGNFAAVLDDTVFAGSGGQNVFGFRVFFTTSSTPVLEFTLGLSFYNSFTATPASGQPVNSNATADGFIGVNFAAGGTGFATGALFSTRWLTSDFLPGDFTTLSNNMAIEFNAFQSSGGTTNFSAAQPNIGPAFNPAGPVIGSTTPGFYTNGNNVTSGQYFPAGLSTIGTGGASAVAWSFVVAQPAVASNFGACCLNPPGQAVAGGGPGPSGCVILTSAACTALGGTFRGNGSTCATASPACTYGTGVLFSNGPIATGTNSSDGSGSIFLGLNQQFSEDPVTVNGDGTTCSSVFVGYAAFSPFSQVDDFVVPAGQQWTVNQLRVYAFAIGGSTATPPFTQAFLRLWSGQPSEPAGTVIYGNNTTPVAVTGSFTNVFRIGNPLAGGGFGTPNTNLPIWEMRIPISPAVVLGPGTYSYDWRANVSGGVFTPVVSPANYSNSPSNVGNYFAIGEANARFRFDQGTSPGIYFTNFVDSIATPATAFGQNNTCYPIALGWPFQVVGTSQTTGPVTCYANCDQSTTPPVLNAGDFSCFLTRFRAAGSLSPAAQIADYSNCDGSTTPPVLNAGDFSCFLGRFRNPGTGTNCN